MIHDTVINLELTTIEDIKLNAGAPDDVLMFKLPAYLDNHSVKAFLRLQIRLLPGMAIPLYIASPMNRAKRFRTSNYTLQPCLWVSSFPITAQLYIDV